MNSIARLLSVFFLVSSCSPDPSSEARASDVLVDVPDVDVDADVDAETADSNADADVTADLEPIDEVGADFWDTAGPAPEGQSLSALQSPANALAYYIDWTKPEGAGAANFVLECGLEFSHEFRDDSINLAGEFFLIGLIADVPCQLSLSTEGGVAVTSFTPGPLPDFLPALTVETTGEVQPGWTLINLNNHFEEQPLSVALFDEQGRYRWYHWVSSEMGSDNEVSVVEGGVLIGGRSRLQAPQRIDWRGRQLWTFPNILMHHDIRLIDEDTIRFLADADHCGTGVRDGRVEEFNIESGETEWEFKLCEFYLPEDGVTPDWSHLNSIGPYGESGILVSSREQHTIFLIDRESGEVVWSAGQNGSIVPSDDAAFYRQHGAEEVADGNILLFDNGLEGTREFSRAIELDVDPETGTAEVVWEFVPDPPIAAYIWGDADRQPNGNTLITFGVRNVRKITHLYEVDEDAEVVARVTFPVGWGVYRSDRVAPPDFIHVYPRD